MSKPANNRFFRAVLMLCLTPAVIGCVSNISSESTMPTPAQQTSTPLSAPEHFYLAFGNRAVGIPCIMPESTFPNGCFIITHLRDQPGEKITEVISYETFAGLDNSSGVAPLRVPIQLERKYHNEIIVQLNTDDISSYWVSATIAELHKLSPDNPELTMQTALFTFSIVIPVGAKAVITIEWTERWAEGVINEGSEGEGNQLGTYKVFLGYFEPCSFKQENLTRSIPSNTP